MGGKVLPIILIGFGGFLLLILGIVALTFTGIIKVAVPIGLGLLPTDELLQAWIDIPLGMYIQAYLSNVKTSKEDDFLAVGHIDFKATLDSRDEDDTQVPALFIEESAAIDQIQRYVLQPGPLNYGSVFSWLLVPVSLMMSITGVCLRFSGKKNEEDTRTGIVEKVDDY